jgi:hypothetical protein
MSRACDCLTACLAVPLLGGLIVRAADPEQDKVALDNLPRTVLDGVKAKYKDGELLDAYKEREDGNLVYQIHLRHNSQPLEVTVSPEGKVLCISRTMVFKDLPRPVVEAVNAKYPKSTLKKVEEVTRGDQKRYRVFLLRADEEKLIHLLLTANGEMVPEKAR